MKKENQLQKRNGSETKQLVLTAEFGEMYVKVQNGQIMRPVKAKMTLFEKMGHVYKVSGKWGITKSGYNYMNQVASINIVTPQFVVVDGIKQPNPYIERNQKTKAIETVNLRKIGIGYSPAGNITVVDKTLFYNIYTYFIQSIQAKMKKVEWKNSLPTDVRVHPNCAKIGTSRTRPEEGKWAFYEIASPLGIWVNYEDPAIIDCLEEHTQRQRFGDRIAQTIVERNILKDHPAIGIAQVEMKQHRKEEGGDRAFVTVYGYRHDLDPPDIDEIMKQAEEGSKTIDIDSETIEEVPQDEEKQVIEEEAEAPGEKGSSEKKPSPATMSEPPDDWKGDK